MAESLRAEDRQGATKSENKRLRKQGKIPGIVYGKKIDNRPIAVDQKELQKLIKTNRHAIVDLEIPGKGKQPVMLSEIQRDNLTGELLHVDFHQINMDEPVRTNVPLEFVGDSVGVREGGLLTPIAHEIEIRCLPKHIPAALQVDVSALGVGETLLVGDIRVPAEIEIKSEMDMPVVTVLAPQKEAKDEAAEAAEAEKAEETV
jgi:large subunit ribosomal protein L25